MLVLQIMALGLLLHEAVYISSKGYAHWRENIAPVLGLRLSPKSCEFLHLANVISNFTLLAAPFLWFAQLSSLLTLTLLIASFPKRLPNHIIVAWFFLCEFNLAKIIEPISSNLLFSNTHFALGMVQTTTILLYAIAGFHKLNTDFFSPKRSCGAGFVVLYLLQRGIRMKQWPSYAAPLGIYFVVVAELILPILLFVDSWRPFGLILAILLHCAFGFLAHLHFSVIMFAGIASFLPQQPITEFLLPSNLLLIPLFIGIPVGLFLGNYLPYRYLLIAKANHIVFGIISVSMFIYVFSKNPGQLLILQSFNERPIIFSIPILLFILNGIAPYFGVKQDFSLSMFSNLRMDNWCHFIISRPFFNFSPRYLKVDILKDELEGLEVANLLDEYFSDRERYIYSIIYVMDVLNKIQQDVLNKGKVYVSVTDIVSGEKFTLLASDRDKLRVHERLSVFPYMLPLDYSIPVLS